MKVRVVLALCAALTLAGCSALGQNTPQALPTIVLDEATNTAQPPSMGSSAGVTASGNVTPAQEAHLAFPVGGIVGEVNAAAGDAVEAGQVLVRLAGSERLAAAVDLAKLEQLAAQQELLNAEQARQELFDTLPTAQTNALQELNDARQALKDADRAVGCSPASATSRSATRAGATTCGRSMRPAPATAAATSRAPTCITCRRRTRSSARA